MQRTGASNGSAAALRRPGAPAAAKVAPEETFVLRATPSIKRYNIARFDVPTLPKFSTCEQPVMMYREPERVIEDDEGEKKEEEVGYNPALRKRRRRRRKDTRTAGWVIEDQGGKTKFNGTFEGGQSSTYMLLIKNRHNDEFSVIPVEQWFRFKKPLGYRTLTLEEAEDLNNEKKRAVERWLMKHKLAGEKEDQGDIVSAPRVRTGAIGGPKVKKAEATDLFEVSEAKPRGVPRAKKAAESGPTGQDGGDFEEKFDDDESEPEIENDAEVKGVPSDSEEDEFEVDPEGGKLTETGQAMKDLLKRAQSGEMGDTTNDKDEEDGASSEDEYSAQDMEKIRRDLGGNIIRDRSDAASSSSAPAADAKSNAAAAAENGEAKAKAGTASSDSVTGKRKAEDGPKKEEPPTKSSKTSSTTSSTATKLTEAGVQQELMRYGGRMRTRDLLRKLKKLLVTDDDKALLKDILRTICDVEVDAIDGRLLVLKSQFR
ncbi:TPA: hypothetical protein N0F65_009587 [Lagenidium giganteum]|uniref:Transcription initiation factor IIF subunit alpha n=1 Tax=Lagenidium giganteum TaxID=4803 RepID=A0AAV2YIR7_9STRA|nr:TPA: hypothetical protein N0F65_009587 [Lagenidium giganteum]